MGTRRAGRVLQAGHAVVQAAKVCRHRLHEPEGLITLLTVLNLTAVVVVVVVVSAASTAVVPVAAAAVVVVVVNTASAAAAVVEAFPVTADVVVTAAVVSSPAAAPATFAATAAALVALVLGGRGRGRSVEIGDGGVPPWDQRHHGFHQGLHLGVHLGVYLSHQVVQLGAVRVGDVGDEGLHCERADCARLLHACARQEDALRLFDELFDGVG